MALYFRQKMPITVLSVSSSSLSTPSPAYLPTAVRPSGQTTTLSGQSFREKYIYIYMCVYTLKRNCK